MASNDMNSWDEDPDERLRWQQMFADFEVQPRSSLSRRILGQLPNGRRRKPTRWLAGVALLLLLSAGLVYVVRQGERPESGRGNANTVQQPIPVQPLSAGRVRPPMDPNERSESPSLPITDPLANETVAQRQPPVHPPTVSEVADAGVMAPRVDVSRKGAAAGRTVPTGYLPAGQATLRTGRGAGLRLRATPLFARQLRSKSVRSGRTRFRPGSSGPATAVSDELTANPAERSGSRSPLSVPTLSVIQPSANAAPIVGTRLKSLGIMPLAHSLSALTGQLPVVVESPESVKSAVARSRPRWFVEAVPLSSFQWMRAPSASTAYLSPVDAPAAFSPATWGYQINGGMRFRRWQAHLSMGQLRRWAYYTVHENRYRVEPSPTEPHHLVRETYTVAENVALPMIGAGLSQQTLLARGRYAIELGGQVSYLPTSDQALISLRGGVGRRLLLSQRTELQVDLTVGYGLNQLLSEQQHLVIHPLLVGIGLRIQPRSGQ